MPEALGPIPRALRHKGDPLTSTSMREDYLDALENLSEVNVRAVMRKVKV